MLSPHIGVDAHEEGVAVRVRHCLIVLPPDMAAEFAEAIVVAVAAGRRPTAAELPEATVLGQDGKPTKIEL